ncbi:MAG: flagellar basal body L-ring protein, partial [Lysobacteraceae bacterium]
QWAGPLSPPSQTDLADQHAITQLAKVYALGIDMRDLDLVLSVFDPDGIGEGTVGSLPLKDYLTKTYEGAAAFPTTQHTMLNQYVTVQGDEATMWTYAVAYHIRAKDDANGNLTVAARQEVRVNSELRDLQVSGVIRPQDIASDNTVQHDRMAEARISYGGRGQLTDVQQARYGQQLLDILLPF